MSSRNRCVAASDVVGTLAAVDQVTISSEADGKVSRILADLGDRVTAGDSAHPPRQREAAIQLRPAEGGARSRIGAVGAPDPQHLPDIEKTPDVQKAAAELSPGPRRRSSARRNSTSAR